MKRAHDVLAHCPERRPEAHRLPNMQSVFLHADADDPIIRNRLIPWENQEGNSIPYFDLPQTEIRKDTARRRIPLGLAIVGQKILACFSYILPNEKREECVFNTFGLYTATEHEVRHTRLLAVHNAETNHSIAAETILTVQYVRVQVRCGLDSFQNYLGHSGCRRNSFGWCAA